MDVRGPPANQRPGPDVWVSQPTAKTTFNSIIVTMFEWPCGNREGACKPSDDGMESSGIDCTRLLLFCLRLTCCEPARPPRLCLCGCTMSPLADPGLCTQLRAAGHNLTGEKQQHTRHQQKQQQQTRKVGTRGLLRRAFAVLIRSYSTLFLVVDQTNRAAMEKTEKKERKKKKKEENKNKHKRRA